MMTDDAADTGAENGVMAGEMPGDSTYGSTLQAAGSLDRRRDPAAAIKKATAAGNNMNFI